MCPNQRKIFFELPLQPPEIIKIIGQDHLGRYKKELNAAQLKSRYLAKQI